MTICIYACISITSIIINTTTIACLFLGFKPSKGKLVKLTQRIEGKQSHQQQIW